ncbi:unnamed protein product [Ixodes pacificus]
MEYLELCWWNHCVRMADLLDTIFFVLRKRDSHVSFLHVFHHGAVLFCGWYALAYGSDGQPASGICVNSFIHADMHSYYFLSLLGPAFCPYLWWKRHLTQLQLLQFGIIFIHGLVPLFIDCGYPRFHMPSASRLEFGGLAARSGSRSELIFTPCLLLSMRLAWQQERHR